MQFKIKKEDIKKLSVIIFGTFIMSIGISYLYAPANIVAGGVVGIATILTNKLNVPMGITIIVLNSLLFVLCGLVLGKDMLKKSILGVAFLALFVQIGEFTNPYVEPYLVDITSNLLLVTIFGGLMDGVGLGMIFAAGASTGGSDILARLIQHRFKFLKIGKLLLLIDACIILLSYMVFKNILLVMYGILLLLIATFTIDFLIKQLNVSKLAFVVSAQGEKVSLKLMSDFPRGVTILEAEGAYTHRPKKMLICALKNRQMKDFQRAVLEADKEAFIIFSESQQIIGNGFRYYQ